MFLRRLSKLFEITIFTASIKKYADSIMDKLDPEGYCTYRLYRDGCSSYKHGNGLVYIKDLSKLGRKLKNTIILDNSPISYIFQ